MTHGDRVHVFETDRGRIAILICYDIEFPEIVQLVSVGEEPSRQKTPPPLDHTELPEIVLEVTNTLPQAEMPPPPPGRPARRA